MARKQRFGAENLRKLWGSGKPITYKGKKYRVCRMSYGDFFLEPMSWKGGETEGFSSGTLWLEKAKDNPYFYEVSTELWSGS